MNPPNPMLGITLLFIGGLFFVGWILKEANVVNKWWLSTGFLVYLIISIPSALCFYSWEVTSPATRTITLHEMNDAGYRVWRGPENVSINLTITPTLIAEERSDNQQTYILDPAIKHESNGTTLQVDLTLRIPNTYQFKPLSWVFLRHAWTPKIVDGYTEYTTPIEQVPWGTPHRMNEGQGFGFQSPKPGTYDITYIVGGIDDKGREVKPKETVVRITLK